MTGVSSAVLCPYIGHASSERSTAIRPESADCEMIAPGPTTICLRPPDETRFSFCPVHVPSLADHHVPTASTLPEPTAPAIHRPYHDVGTPLPRIAACVPDASSRSGLVTEPANSRSVVWNELPIT